MKTRRRAVLVGATAAIAARGSLPAAAIAQGLRELKMVTSWPANSPGMQTSADRLAASITALSEGRIKITVYPADALTRSLMRSAPVRPICITPARVFPKIRLWR
jgi:TRAP-type mannitol/chloroaromatic compound transport system substrate-binding protein